MRQFRLPHFQFYTFFPTNLTISHNTVKPIKKATHEGKPNAVGKTPNSTATPPTVSAYGICVLTCCK